METEVVLSDSSDDLDNLPSFKERVERLKNLEFKETVINSRLKRSISAVHSISDSEGSEIDNDINLLSVHNVLNTKKDVSKQKVVHMSSNDELPDINFKRHCENIQDSLLIKEVLNIDNIHSSIDEFSVRNEKQVEKNSKKTAKAKIKGIEKEQQMKLKEEKKRQKEIAKVLKLSEKEILNSKKPSECLKNMKLVMDHHILFLSGSQQIFNILDQNNYKYDIEENIVKHSILWYRTETNISVNNDEIVKEERDNQVNVLLLIIPNEDFLKMIHSFTQKSKGKETADLSLAEFVCSVTSLHSEMDITYVIIGFDKYMRDLKEQGNEDLKQLAKHVHKNSTEQAIVELQVQAFVNFHILNSMMEFCNLLCQFTKAIAETPLKKEKQLQKASAFSWYADMDSNCPVKLSKDGTNFIKLWHQQVQQFQNVGPEVAEAIVSRYPSPRLLLKAYQACASSKEAENLLQDIVVRRNYGPLGTQKRIGPELSFKIHRFFTSLNGNHMLKR